MDTLFLHIGGFKCGSSFIQSCLRLSRENLESQGLLYPIRTDENEEAYSWTRGNAFNLLESSDEFEGLIRAFQNRGFRSLVFSNENLCVDIREEEAERVLLKAADLFEFEKVKILFLIRNPIEYTVSVWAQDIKNGITLDFEEFLDKHYDHYADFLMHTSCIVERLLSNPKIELTLLNYSVCKAGLLKVTSEWLGIPPESLNSPGSDPVNRSLDLSEARLQLELNRSFGVRREFLCQALTEQITDIHPVKQVPSQDMQRKIWEKAMPFADKLNRFLPEGHQIRLDLQEPYKHTDDTYTFHSDQIRVIAESFAGEMKHMESRLKSVNSELDTVRSELETVQSKLNAIYASETTLMRFIRRISSRLRSKKGSPGDQ